MQYSTGLYNSFHHVQYLYWIRTINDQVVKFAFLAAPSATLVGVHEPVHRSPYASPMALEGAILSWVAEVSLEPGEGLVNTAVVVRELVIPVGVDDDLIGLPSPLQRSRQLQ